MSSASLTVRAVRARMSRSVLVASLWLGFIGVAIEWGWALDSADPRIRLDSPPLYGRFDPHLPAGIAIAGVSGAALIIVVTRAARGLRWSNFPFAFTLVTFSWAVLLASASDAGLAGGVESRYDVFHALPDVGSLSGFLDGFVDKIAAYPVHVQGHPPGTVVFAWSLRALGIVDPVAIALVLIAIGASATAALLIAIKAVWSEDAARRAAPFVALAPAAVWVATSVDALIAGVGAWSVALGILATTKTGRARVAFAAASGLFFGAVLMLSYGAALLALVFGSYALRTRAWDVLGLILLGTAAVLGLAASAGFWWTEGFAATRGRYLLGLSKYRPYSYFVVGNLAAFAIAAGPALFEGLRRVWSTKGRYLAGAVIMCVAFADLSGMSKGEVERIWLLFVPWVLCATGAIERHERRWLGAQLATALAVQCLVVTPW